LQNKLLITHVPAAPEPRIQTLKVLNKGSNESWHAIYDGKDLKVDTKIQKTTFLGMNSLKKWLNKYLHQF
jgi:hypothetical protein